MGPTPKPGQAPKPPIEPFVAACHALFSALATFDSKLTTALGTRGTLRSTYLEGPSGWQGKYHGDFVTKFTAQKSAITTAAETARTLKGGVNDCLSKTVAYYNSQP